jgi:hypothetical protein
MKTVDLPERGDTFRLFNNLQLLECESVSVTLTYSNAWSRDGVTRDVMTYTTDLANISSINDHGRSGLSRGVAASSVPAVTPVVPRRTRLVKRMRLLKKAVTS